MACKVIGVIGATGRQGGGLVRAILANNKQSNFVARAITRNPNSHNAKALQAAGAELVQANVLDTAALAEAIKGVDGLFCVSTFDLGPENEAAQIKSMASAAKLAGVKHVIWSTLEDTRLNIPAHSRMPWLGRYRVPHFDVKGENDRLFENLPTTFLLTCCFWENFYESMAPFKGPDGRFFWSIPMHKKKISGHAAEDVGKCALGIFQSPREYIGKRVGIVGEQLTAQKIAEKMSKALGKEIIPLTVMPFDVFRAQKFPSAIEYGNMFEWLHDNSENYLATRSIKESRKLNPEMLTFDRWLLENSKNFKL